MGSIKPEVAGRIRGAKVLCILVGHDELTSDVPQFKSDKTGEDLAWRCAATRSLYSTSGPQPSDRADYEQQRCHKGQ